MSRYETGASLAGPLLEAMQEWDKSDDEGCGHTRGWLYDRMRGRHPGRKFSRSVLEDALSLLEARGEVLRAKRPGSNLWVFYPIFSNG